MDRRHFLKTGAAAATSFMVLPNWVVGNGPSPNSKVNIAVIGVGGRGKNHVDGYENENIVALCDVDDERAAYSYEKHPNVPRFRDYREMFDKMGDKIDAVSIATPDHMHYPIALWALMMGKHVYCEKPLVRTIWEARQLKAVAAKAGVVTQMGNQGHTYEGLRYIKEWTQAGILGEVKEVMHWSNRPIWRQGELTRANEKVPATLDYDLWLGVAPKKSFDSNIVPFQWRGWKDYGCGAIGDMACHIMDSSFSGLGLDRPFAIEASASGSHAETFPNSETISYRFANPNGGKPIKVTWSDGGRLPDLKKAPGVPADFFAERVDGQGRKRKSNENGTFIVGDKGTLWTDTYSSTVKVFPEDYFKQLRSDKALPKKTLKRVKGGPFREFAEAIRNGEKAGSDFQYAADFTETALLGIVALEAGEKIKYNAKKGVVTNLPEANKYLESQYDYKKEFLPA
ncbi:Gfo/Idh/MocA family protein [Pelagicoccus mobilis]|uniref:Gfo/Idh/MocA family oxidoreductase n=1 Tax=Pelagicoccus mobilis TaxID=415221 RepID=A0A934S0M9_9BACT|nr:Gfo/Idh/MocA family oxidoreductase [Pelagicoccus mobilis]MBK1880151.1 Gfo/Idh/MocA family oxidoreductase [Pelagicoccus mobilis]